MFGDLVNILEENGVFYVGQFMYDDKAIQGNGSVYYPSGLVVEGTFKDGFPEGEVIFHHEMSGVKEKVVCVNGHRTSSMDQPSLLTFNAGYQLKAGVKDVNLQAFQSQIPFVRNFYHSSYFHLGRPTLSIPLSFQEGVDCPLPSEVALWSIQHFDIQQPSMVVDLTNASLSSLQDYCEDEWFRSEKSNCLQHISLICHTLVRLNLLNSIIPEVIRFRRINQITRDNVQEVHEKRLSSELITRYDVNLKSVMNVLEKSPKLSTLTLIAYPFSPLVMKNYEMVWKKLRAWEFKSREWDCSYSFFLKFYFILFYFIFYIIL